MNAAFEIETLRQNGYSWVTFFEICDLNNSDLLSEQKETLLSLQLRPDVLVWAHSSERTLSGVNIQLRRR